MSSLNLKRRWCTNANGSPTGSHSSFGSENSYWLTTRRIRCLRTKRSCWFGSNTLTNLRVQVVKVMPKLAPRAPRSGAERDRRALLLVVHIEPVVEAAEHTAAAEIRSQERQIVITHHEDGGCA